MKKYVIIILFIILAIISSFILLYNIDIKNNGTSIDIIETKKEETMGCSEIKVTLNGFSFILGKVDYDEFKENTNFTLTQDHKHNSYGEYLSDGYSQIYVNLNKNKKVKEIKIGNNMENGHIYYDSNNTSFSIDNNDIKFGMGKDEIKNLNTYSNEQFSSNSIYLYSNQCNNYNSAYKSNVLIQAFFNNDDIIFGFWIGK